MTVEDRGSAIRVERLTAIPVGAKGYVKVETSGYLKPDDLLFLEEAWVPGNIEAAVAAPAQG